MIQKLPQIIPKSVLNLIICLYLFNLFTYLSQFARTYNKYNYKYSFQTIDKMTVGQKANDVYLYKHA